MRNFYRFTQTIALAVIFTTIAFAQNPIANPGFENWTDGNPNNWTTYNLPGFYVPITQSTIKHSGNYAVKGEVINYIGGILPPILLSGDVLMPITQNYTRMTGYYQMTNMGEDAFFVEIIFYDAQSSPVAFGSAELGATNSGYQMFSVDMEYVYQNQEAAANAYIYIFIDVASESSLEDVTLGSNFLLDDLDFDNVSALDNAESGNQPLKFSLNQNYPNPFNPTTKIKFTLPESELVKLSVFNSLGQQVSSILNEKREAGYHEVEFNANDLPSGAYFYQIEAGNFKKVRKMLIIK